MRKEYEAQEAAASGNVPSQQFQLAPGSTLKLELKPAQSLKQRSSRSAASKAAAAEDAILVCSGSLKLRPPPATSTRQAAAMQAADQRDSEVNPAGSQLPGEENWWGEFQS